MSDAASYSAMVPSMRPRLGIILTYVCLAGVPAVASATLGTVVSPVAEAAPPIDGLMFGRAFYMGVLLLAVGTAWFRVLIPVPTHMAVPLRRALSLFAAGGLLAGGLSLSQLNALAVVGFATLLMGSWRGQRSLLLGGALALAISRALLGHPANLEPGFLLMPLMVLHVSCAAYWAGSLWPLHRLLSRETAVIAAPAVARFSRLALAAVGSLAAVGIVTAAIHLRAPTALLNTWYGQLLIMKSTWFTVLMGIAAYHKLRLTPRLMAGDSKAARYMRWGIRAEMAIMVLVILLSSLLASTPPGAPPRESARKDLGAPAGDPGLRPYGESKAS